MTSPEYPKHISENFVQPTEEDVAFADRVIDRAEVTGESYMEAFYAEQAEETPQSDTEGGSE